MTSMYQSSNIQLLLKMTRETTKTSITRTSDDENDDVEPHVDDGDEMEELKTSASQAEDIKFTKIKRKRKNKK